MTRIIGIDPGLSGAIACYDLEDERLVVRDIPTHELVRNGKKKREVDLYALARIIDDFASVQGARFWIEQVGAMPGQGVSSVFAFGKVYGVLLGVAAATFAPIETVPPQVWKRALKVPAAKDGARARASALFPNQSGLWARAKDDGRAEAALITAYGVRIHRDLLDFAA